MIVRIYTAPATGSPLTAWRSRTAIAALGLEGDRYASGHGFYSGVPGWDAQITLIEIEPVEALATNHGCTLDPQILRRNLLTRGVDLTTLIGQEFRIGPDVILRGRKVWPPCAHIVRQSGRTEIFQHLARQTGIGADVVTGGLITLGDVNVT